MKITYSVYKKIGLVLGPIFFILFYNLPEPIISTEANKVIAIAVWMIIWWITEVVSISVTALIPLTIFPLFDIMDMKTVAMNYGNPIVFLFFGGFIMALALEKVGLHKRIALNIIKITGTSPNKVILGFMLATAFLSMWISNTATTVVMLPIALSVIHLLIKNKDNPTREDKNFMLSMMLGIAFSANVGGIATIIGTPPNIVAVGFLEQEYGIQISFLKWMLIGIPFAALMIITIYFILVKCIYPNHLSSHYDTENIINEELTKLGSLTKHELRVTIIFIITVFLWITRVYINKYFDFLKLSDTGISMLAAFALFTIPLNFKKGIFVLTWKETVKLPWGILILFGGGLALANGLSNFGVIENIGQIISLNKNIAPFIVTPLLIIVVLFMTELMSNVALIAIFSPVIAGIAMGFDNNMLHMLIPITMASSCAFMLPMATPPNAIVFASGHIKVHEMLRAGVFLNIISILLLIVFSYFLIPYIF